METEVWKDIPGYEGLHKVSNLGRVKSFKYGSEKIRNQYNNRGYKYVSISGKPKKVHRLVLSTFLGESDLHCNHKDKNRGNNNINNLEWVTIKENNAHKFAFGDVISPRMYDNKKCKKVFVFSNKGNFLFFCPGIIIASIITGVNHGDISRCCNGKAKLVGEFIFRYSGSNLEIQPKIFIDQYSKDGTFLKRWNSAMDITKILGIDNSSIIKNCRGKIKSAGGYIWKYNT